MGIGVVFVLGVINFALHRAVLDADHPMVVRLRESGVLFTPRVTIAIEFVLLLGALWLVASGHGGWVLAYVLYSLFNIGSAWAILTRRI